MPSCTLSSMAASSRGPSLEHVVEGLRLRHRAREAVENEAVLGVRLADAVGDDLHHHVVGDQLAARHDVARLEADRRPGLHGRPQHVAGRERHDAVFSGQALGWVPLPQPGGPSRINLIVRRPPQLRALDQTFILMGQQIAWTCATVSMVTLTTISSEVPPK